MKSKKAFLLGEYTLKIIIAVLCILLLIYVLYTLYSNSQNERELQMAKAVLEDLSEKMMVAKEKSPQLQEFVVLGFKKWALISYSEGENMPLSCKGDCVCLCSKREVREAQVNACNEKGVCKNFNEKIKKFEFGYIVSEDASKYEGGHIGDLSIKYENNQFEIMKIVNENKNE